METEIILRRDDADKIGLNRTMQYGNKSAEEQMFDLCKV